MEGSRIRTIFGAGLLVIGSLLLFRALLAPVVSGFSSSPLAGREIEQALRMEERQAQLEMRRAELEVQQERRRAELEAQRALRQAELDEQMRGALDREAHTGPLAELPPLPAVPPLPPAPPSWHLGAGLSPAVVLLALLVLLIWRRGRGERAPQQL